MNSQRTQKEKFEDLNDPERRCAMDFGFVTDIKERGRKVGKCHSWFMEDREQAVNIVVRNDGTLAAFIEEFDEEFPDA